MFKNAGVYFLSSVGLASGNWHDKMKFSARGFLLLFF